jgi:hypothetical protein
MRASTGTVPLGSNHDSYPSQTSRYAYDGYIPPESVGERIPDTSHRGNQDARLGHDRKLEAQRISSTTYRDPGQSTKLRTEYAIRSRPRSNTSSVAEPSRRPLNVIIPSTANTQPPVITSAYDRSASPLPSRSPFLRDSGDRYLVPASSTHHQRRRIYNSGYGSDTGRLDRPGPRDHGVYRVYKPGGWSGYSGSGDLRREIDSDYYDAYSYTNPREQFEKDSQRLAHKTGRPLSMTGLDSFLPQPAARERPRPQKPPPSQRGFDKLNEDERLRHSGRSYADSDVGRESGSSRRWSSLRSPVAVHQDRDDRRPIYGEDYDDYRDHRYRRRHGADSTSRHRRDDRELGRHSAGDLLSPVIGGLATLGLASGYSEEALDFDRYSLHRSRDLARGHEREDNVESQGHTSRGKSKGSENVGNEAQSRRRTARPQHRTHSDSGQTSSGEESPKNQREASTRRRRDSGSSDSSGSRDDMGKSHRQHREDNSSKLIAVDPTPTKDPEAPPKGILKPPRPKFPEELNPIREGVAPLKDAQKKGIPPGARWTKIDRRLVNPAALKAGRERFEERSDYVIVLRVLTKEEIQGYAVKTQEIRGKFTCGCLKTVSKEGGPLILPKQMLAIEQRGESAENQEKAVLLATTTMKTTKLP